MLTRSRLNEDFCFWKKRHFILIFFFFSCHSNKKHSFLFFLSYIFIVWCCNNVFYLSYKFEESLCCAVKSLKNIKVSLCLEVEETLRHCGYLLAEALASGDM